MNTIENARLELLHQLQRDLQHERRRRALGAIAGTVIALALWGAIIAAVVALT